MNLLNPSTGEALIVGPSASSSTLLNSLTVALSVKWGTSNEQVAAYRYQSAGSIDVNLYEALAIDAVANNKVSFEVLRTKSQLFPVGELIANVLINFKDATIAGNSRTEEYTYVMGNILPGYTKDLL